MIYKPRVPTATTQAYGHGSGAEPVIDPEARTNAWANFLAGPRLPPGLALLFGLLVSLLLWAGLFGILHFFGLRA